MRGSSATLWRSLAILGLFAAASLAQSPSPLKSVIGEVTAVDAAAKQIKLKGDDGTAYTITLADNTSFLRIPPGEKDLKKAAKIAFSDLTVGDRALARVPSDGANSGLPARTIVIMTKGDLAQKHERDRAEWQRRGIVGVVTAVDAGAKQVTVTTRGRDAKTMTIDASAAGFERYSPESTKFADAKPGTFADIQVGDTLRALGDKNEDGTRLKAEEVVSGAFETVAGTIESVDAAANEVRITNLQSKKSEVVKVNQDSLMRRLDPTAAAMLARRLHPATVPAPGAPGTENRPQPAPASGDQAQGPPGGFRGGFNGPGGGGGGARFAGGAGGDLQQILERMPQLVLSELKKGDAVIISASKAPDGAPITAFAFVAGVEPVLEAAPRSSGQVNLGSWNLDIGGGPEE